MNREESRVIDTYLPAAHLMVVAHAQTNTLEEAVNMVRDDHPYFEAGYLRLIWLGINAKDREGL